MEKHDPACARTIISLRNRPKPARAFGATSERDSAHCASDPISNSFREKKDDFILVYIAESDNDCVVCRVCVCVCVCVCMCACV